MARKFRYDNEPIKHALVAAGAATRDYAASRRSSGFVGPLVAGEPFVGFFQETVAAPSANGGARAAVSMKGRVELDIAGVAQTNLGDDVYASGPNTFTLTSTDNSIIGRIISILETGKCVVEYADVPD